MKTITFYSYKGGVGRTLALSNMASRLAEMGKKVCMLDFDLEAPGLHYKFNNYIKTQEISNGLVDYINDYLSQGHPPKTLKKYVSKIKFAKRNKSDVNLISAGGFSDDNYWKELSKINWYDLLYEPESIGIQLFLGLKKRIQQELKPDYLLIDSRTGITDISGITLSLLADEVVLLSSNNIESVNGSKQVLKAILNKNNIISGILPKIHFVLSRIPQQNRSRDEEILVDSKREDLNTYFIENEIDYQIEKILLIHSDRDLELRESFKIDRTLVNGPNKKVHPIYNDYIKLFESITEGDFKDEELFKFHKKKDAESLIEESWHEKNHLKKIDLLKKAVLLDSGSADAYYMLGQNFAAGGKHDEAIVSFKKALKLNPENHDIINSLAHSYFDSFLIIKAGEIINYGLKIFPDNKLLLLNRAVILNHLNRYADAVEAYEKLLINFPNNSKVRNNLGYSLWKLGRVEEALQHLYKALEINSANGYTFTTLAEISIDQGNLQEFYKNFELAIQFKGNIEKAIIQEYKLYSKVFNEQRFQKLIKRENIDLDELKIRYEKRLESIEEVKNIIL